MVNMIWKILIPENRIDFHDWKTVHAQDNYCQISFRQARINLKNLEKSGKLKYDSKSQGKCHKIPRAREKSGDIVV